MRSHGPHGELHALEPSRGEARPGSLFLELDDGRRVLFDMGPDASFLDNARALGVDAASAGLAVLSHGHYDHGGGLAAFLECHERARDEGLHVREGAFGTFASGTPERNHGIGIDPSLADDPRVVRVGERHELGDGLLLFTARRRDHEIARSNRRLMALGDGGLVPDDFSHEQSLLVREGGRHVLGVGLLAWGHPQHHGRRGGVIRGRADGRRRGRHAPDGPEPAAPSRTPRSHAAWRASSPSGGARYLTFHCTGTDAFSLLRDELGERVGYLHVGSVAEA